MIRMGFENKNHDQPLVRAWQTLATTLQSLSSFPRKKWQIHHIRMVLFEMESPCGLRIVAT